ncbi:hypothetical protein [Jeongeupia sp. USM3]|uniref:hypothetical protein n=1 Tax=Jeongeupia sp. USM3 TaxID=1906741 RepID=UPI00089DDCB4|nr:hypothetical protein [Jeongeupia sp. USM3]AOX99675.1 hypothetical protein BJP62_03915 [Jeongeupia sp. USM3]
MKRTMLASLALVISTQALAYGEDGRWSSAWGQGTDEYTTVSGHNSLYIACNDSRPVAMILKAGQREYGSYAGRDFDLLIDGRPYQTPYKTDSRAGSNTFYGLWDALRSGKTLQARTADGMLIKLPLKDAAKVLPATKSKSFSCSTAF